MKSFIDVFLKPRILVTMLLGFSSGLPLALTGGTLQAWLTDVGVSREGVGLFSLVAMPYTLKFLWSPLMDRYQLPFFSKLGRRRSWIVFCQLALFICIILMGSSDPASNTTMIAAMAVLISFLSASQDIVIDAFRAEYLSKDEYGPGASVTILGYRLGMLTSGAAALILSQSYAWKAIYGMMAFTLVFGMITTLVAKEPTLEHGSPKTLKEAVFIPLLEFFRRNAAFEILAFIILYKIGDVMCVALSTRFMLEIGFTKADIGYVNKAAGLVATILGSLVGGAILTKIGLKSALWRFGILQAFAPICFAVLAIYGKNYSIMFASVALENFLSGLGNSPFIALMMSLCNKRFTATQYALLSSLGAVTRVFASAPTGYMVNAIGWTYFFIFCAILSIPGLALVRKRFDYWNSGEQKFA